MKLYRFLTLPDWLRAVVELIWNFLALVGFGTVIYAISKLLKILSIFKEIGKIEDTYSKARNFIKDELSDMAFTINYLPSEIIVEKAIKGEKVLSSSLRSCLKRAVKQITRKKYIQVVIFGDMTYPEQLAYIIKKTFEAVFPFQKVLDLDLRRSLVTYYSYKFALSSEELVGRETIDLLEDELKKSPHKDMLVKLDSKELEEAITLNPPPEVRPLLDRVIIPILRLKSQELLDVTDASLIEMTKSEMSNLLQKLAERKIAILFVGQKTPDEYLAYVREKINWFDGLLICSRGLWVKTHYILEPELSTIMQNIHLTEKLATKYFEGDLLSENNETIHHRYTYMYVNSDAES